MHCLSALTVLLALTGPLFAQIADLKEADKPPAGQGMKERIGRWTFPVRGQADPVQGRFVEYTPSAWDGKSPLPLLIFLHGAGARTELKDAIEPLYAEFFPKRIREGATFDAIVLCPQVRGYWGNEGTVFLDQALKAYEGRIDPDRIYLTGLSSGGGGTWTTALERHDKLAAIVPIAGIKKPADRDAVLIHLPIWAFHNARDPYQKVDYTRAHVDAIKAAGGKFLRYTEYTETPGHSHPGKDGQPVFPKCHEQAWIAAYTDESVWKWLFHQRRGEPARANDPAAEER